MPAGFTVTEEQLAMINWLFNHLEDYFPNIDLFDMQAYTAAYPGDWKKIQDAIWALKGEITAPAGLATDMYDAAQDWDDYKVLPGEWAAVLFWDNPQVQVLFVMVDP